MPRTGCAITGATDAVPVPSTGTATEAGPLTSSPPGQGQSSGGALWTPAYTPGDSQTSWVYSSNPVLHLYRSCYVTVKKPKIPLVVLASTVVAPIRLYPLYCTLTHRHPSAPVALSSAFVSDFCLKFYSVHFIGYNFHSTFRLQFHSEINSFP
jgi:hypothetical protein